MYKEYKVQWVKCKVYLIYDVEKTFKIAKNECHCAWLMQKEKQ